MVFRSRDVHNTLTVVSYLDKTCLKWNFQIGENLLWLKYRLKIGATPRVVEVTTIYEKKIDFMVFSTHIWGHGNQN